MKHYLVSISVCLLIGGGIVLCDFYNLSFLQDLGIMTISLGLGIVGGAFNDDWDSV